MKAAILKTHTFQPVTVALTIETREEWETIKEAASLDVSIPKTMKEVSSKDGFARGKLLVRILEEIRDAARPSVSED